MSTLLTVYCGAAFKEYLLPAVNNANHHILLSKEVFGLPRDIRLEMEVIEYKWSFVQSRGYSLVCEDESFFGKELTDGRIIYLLVEGENQASIMIKQTDSHYVVFNKFHIPVGNTEITIGKENATIVYESELVSKLHAIIVVEEQRVFLKDRSTNGTFVNNKVVYGKRELEFGDCIDLFGLRIVFLGECIAINTIKDSRIVIDEEVLRPRTGLCLDNAKSVDALSASPIQFYHRSPRYIAKIEDAPLRIDAAPAPQAPMQQSLLMTLGPSLTMALPMVLGTIITSMAYSRTGMSRGVFMYTGLITCVGSALLGATWGFFNIRRARKKFKQDAEHRIRAYAEYLDKREKLIAETYQKNKAALFERYPSAEKCRSYDATSTTLWNRNIHQDDYLTHRLGLGDVPFQAPIIVPEEKFTLITDELMERPEKIRSLYQTIHQAPVCVNLLREKLIGIVGGRHKKGAISIAYNFVSQIAANNCYTDIKLIIVYNKKGADVSGTWSFAKWLPHVWNESRTFRFVADNKEDATDVFYELMKVLRFRTEEKTIFSSAVNVVPKPYYVMILEEPGFLEGELVSKYVLEPKDEYGLTTILLAENVEDLPNECEYIIENNRWNTTHYHVYDDPDERINITFDETSAAALEEFARNIADIEVSETESSGDIPTHLTFLDMYGVKRLQDLNVLERWRKNRNYDSMRALVGAKSGGAPCYLDIHEKYHGPHGLVAGTTGSGKSETLQTYILSLSINFSPDDVGFFVIDYKGGGMANLFNDLPHLIGQISNLSGNQVRRAMVSIKSENMRRQRIFNEYGVNNINSYTKLYKNNEARIPIPHMFIIIDEFAELKREEPEFMRELISVAQVGRSLGVHLILATQKPSGTVDDNIWSNSKFRLCLRVQDRQDSNDMLHKPDAAYITQSGRCYLQVGNDELFELFQSGWSGAPYIEGEETDAGHVAKMISINGKAALEGNRTKIKRKEEDKIRWITLLIEVLVSVQYVEGSFTKASTDETEKKMLVARLFKELQDRNINYQYSEYNERILLGFVDLYLLFYTEKKDYEEIAGNIIIAAERGNKKLPEIKEVTQLDAVVEFLARTASVNGYSNDFRLWLPVLSERIILSDLPGNTESMRFHQGNWPALSGSWTMGCPMGIFDDPENQNQDTVILDFAEGGNVAICGSVGSGKSTFLQTMLYSIVNKYTPDDVNIYVLDYSAKMLSPFENLAHVGGVIYEDDSEKADKFFTMIDQIFAERKELFRGGNYAQYIRANGIGTIPVILVVIDNYSNFRTKTENAYDERIMQIAKDGIGFGVYLVLTASGFGMTEIPLKLADNIHTTFCLEMTDVFQYAEIMRKVHLEVFPEVNVKGRGLARIGERILEFQTAIALDAEDDFSRIDLIRQQCICLNESWTGKRARQIPSIPENPTWNQFLSWEETEKLMRTQNILPMGYDEKYASAYGVDLSRTYCYVLSGKSRTGKTNLLKLLMYSAAMKGGDIIIVDYENEFEGVSAQLGAHRITTDEMMQQFMTDFIPIIQERNQVKQQLLREGLEENDIFLRMQSYKKIFVFCGNLVSFIDRAYHPSDDITGYYPALENIIEKGYLHNVYWFFAFNQDGISEVNGTRIYGNVIKNLRGIHLGGNVQAQRMFSFDYIPYTDQSRGLKAGVGLIPSENDEPNTQKIVLPIVRQINHTDNHAVYMGDTTQEVA